MFNKNNSGIGATIGGAAIGIAAGLVTGNLVSGLLVALPTATPGVYNVSNVGSFIVKATAVVTATVTMGAFGAVVGDGIEDLVQEYSSRGKQTK